MHLLAAITATILVATSTTSGLAAAPELAFFGLKTASGLNENLAQLEDVKERTHPYFDHLFTGKTANENASVLLGGGEGPLDYLGITIEGSFRATDLDEIAATEKLFGLDPAQRSIGSCNTQSSDCVAIHYECPEAPPVCHVTLISNKIYGIEETTLDWRRKATDVISK